VYRKAWRLWFVWDLAAAGWGDIRGLEVDYWREVGTAAGLHKREAQGDRAASERVSAHSKPNPEDR